MNGAGNSDGLNDSQVDKLARTMAETVAKAMEAQYKRQDANYKGAKFKVKDIEDFNDELHHLIKGVKESQPGFKTLASAASGTQMAFQDNAGALQQLEAAIEAAKEEAAKAAAALDALKGSAEEGAARNAVETANTKKEAAQKAFAQTMVMTATNAAITAVANYANALIDNSMAMKNIAYDFKNALNDSATATQIYSQTTQSLNKAQSDYKSALYENIKGLLEVATVLFTVAAPITGGLSLFGAAATAAGVVALSAMNNYQKKTTELANRQVDFEGKILSKVETNWKTVTDSGVILAEGMTQLSIQTGKSKVDMKAFAEGLKASKDAIDQSGLGYTEFTDRLSSLANTVFNKVGKSGSHLSEELTKLGYSAQEQIELEADIIARQRGLGKDRQLTDDQLATQVEEAARNYKILNQVLGENAKDAMKKHREEAAQAALVAKFGRDKNTQDKLTALLIAAGNNGYKKVFNEYMRYGRAVSSDTVRVTQSMPGIVAALEKAKEALNDKSLTATSNQFTNTVKDTTLAIGKATTDFTDTHQELVTSLSLSADKGNDANNAYITYLTETGMIQARLNDKQLADNAQALKDAENNKNKLDDSLAEAERKRRAMASAQDSDINALELYATHVLNTSTNFTSAGDKLVDAVTHLADWINGKLPESKRNEVNAASLERAQKISPEAAERESARITVENQLAARNAHRELLKKQQQNIRAGKTASGVGAANLEAIPGAAGATTRGATPPQSNGSVPQVGPPGSAATDALKISQNDLKSAGFLLNSTDVQKDGAPVDRGLLALAKKIQESIPGFKGFNGLNDNWHNVYEPGSVHTKGKAIDFALASKPSLPEGQAIVAMLKSMGASVAIDEYNNPSKNATGGHMHAQLADSGKSLGAGDVAIAGENGPELIHGPGSVTSRIDTGKIFSSIDEKLGKIHAVLMSQHATQGKMLRAVA